jgi:hypothetical protein
MVGEIDRQIERRCYNQEVLKSLSEAINGVRFYLARFGGGMRLL